MSKPLVLSLGSPAVMAALGDLDTMQRWEVLRRDRRPHTVAELASKCGVSLQAAQSSLDLLVDGGLVARVMANARNPNIAYRCEADALFVAWDRASPAQCDFVAALRLKYRDFSRRLLDHHDGDASLDQLLKRGSSVYSTNMLNSEEIAKVMAAAHAIEEALDSARAREEATRHSEESPAAELPYHLCLEFRPLRRRELPIPAFALWDKEYIPKRVEDLERSPTSRLTAKELAVAKRLASGESRPTIARELGLSPNTISATSKRIYAKLGVHSRAEFAARMNGA